MVTGNGRWFAVLALALVAAGIALNYRELVMIGFGLVGCLIAAVVAIARHPDLEITRDVVPRRVREGEGSSGVITVTNAGRRRSMPVEARETLGLNTISVALPDLPAGATHTTHYRLPCDRRGCYTVGPLRIARSDPLRLLVAAHADRTPATLWVLPRIHEASPIPTGRSQELEGPTSNSAPRGGIAFHSLRQYEPGDDPRLIHWRSSARTGTLMVRHTVITNEPKLMIVLDTSATPYEGDSFEDAVRVAASLVAAGVGKRYPTEFRTTGGLVGTIDPNGTGQADVMDKLAAVQPGDGDPGLGALVRMAPLRNRGVSLGVVTGQVRVEQARTIGMVRDRFDMATLVQVGEMFGRPPLNVRGVLSVNASTSEDWAKVWKVRIG